MRDHAASLMVGFMAGFAFAVLFGLYTAVSGTLDYCDSTQELPAVELKIKPQFGTLPPECSHLYNVGKHDAWADCMGVGYVAKRDDI